jgi:uncharacterized phage protein (TIGR02216 family)
VNRPSPSPSREREGSHFGEQAVVLAGLSARLLGWRPDEFWAATPAELAAAWHDGTDEAVAGNELERLMARFPDKVG